MENFKDNLLDFWEDHKKLCIILLALIVLVIILFIIRGVNLKKKAAEEAEAAANAVVETLAQDVEEEVQPTETYKNSLGLDANKDSDGRITIEEEESEEPIEIIPIQTEPTYDTVVTIFDHTSVPNRNMDGSSCKNYLSKVTLADFGTYWGSSLTDEDFAGGNFYMVGVEQNPDDTVLGDLESTGWLINHLDQLNDNDAIKFTNLHVIGSLSSSHVALLCSYDWYSAYGMEDTLVVFEDISNTLEVSDFSDGDIFSATVFKHNITVLDDVKGQRVIMVEYATFD